MDLDYDMIEKTRKIRKLDKREIDGIVKEQEFIFNEQKDDKEESDYQSPAKINVISDRQKAVLETMRMRLSTNQSLEYLKDVGFNISERTLRNDKKKLNDIKLTRLYHIAKIGFVDQHLEKIDKLELVEKKMWEEYHKEQSPYKRVEILVQIANLQPFLSAYYDSTRYVIECRERNLRKTEEDPREYSTVF